MQQKVITTFQVPVDQASITLGDFKRCIDRKQNFKYFFQSYDEDYGLVKEEITGETPAQEVSKTQQRRQRRRDEKKQRRVRRRRL